MSDKKIEWKIARLYYLEGFSQSVIAKKLSISVATVSRALTRAKESGIVKITLADNDDHYDELETRIEKRYGLKECMLTPSFEQADGSRAALVQALETMLPRILPQKGILGVSWGETLKAVAEGLRLQTPPEADVIPMVGAMGTVETGIYPNSIAKTFAERLAGRSFLVNAPAVTDSEEITRTLYTGRSFQPVRSLWENIDVALVGCSGIGRDSSMVRNGIFTIEDIDALAEAGAVSAVNFTFLNADGKPVQNHITKRILHIELPSMKPFPHVVLIASGREKVAPIRTALISGWITSLITDQETATLLL